MSWLDNAHLSKFANCVINDVLVYFHTCSECEVLIAECGTVGCVLASHCAGYVYKLQKFERSQHCYVRHAHNLNLLARVIQDIVFTDACMDMTCSLICGNTRV